ncbi:hypothetical protein HYALB_00012455 [Hymenoscyphus albidus]|uniref:CHAT domain-containing protein n=1 Tax=Hymenoscyphus albidus TaxID=595503 RepID=A0A9N9LTS2_9HELO|nr:hypothetical protein HYALB_00012455 [Hymenoscyphus albidus]
MKLTLEERKSYHSIALEVVRPGTFDAFKSHLNSRPKGFFDIVHFDVHGRVTIQNKQDQQRSNTSYLHFLHEGFLRGYSEDAKNNLVGIPAKAIADELHRRQVPYAVLNACKSANPFGGNEENLSRLFSMENSLKILAMSYNISGAAVKLLCERFYHSFFQDLDSFSDSARQARKGLRDYRIRVELYPRIEVQDWFVPVTYAHLDGQLPKSTEKSSRPCLNVSLRSHSRISTRSVSSASSYMSSKSVEHDNPRFLALQIKPDLVFERQLMRDNVARLFG